MQRDRFPEFLAAAFLAVGAFVMSHHELWRDEVQSWLLARDSTSPWDLLVRQKYEGHPALWQLLLMPLTRLFGTPVAMQCVHLLIATATVYVFARWSPFSRLQKVLFSFGYFPCYEYAIVSRSYGLSVLFLLVFCCLYTYRHRPGGWFAIATVLVLLCHTHALSLIVVLVVVGALVLDHLMAGREAGQLRCPTGPFLSGCALIIVGVVTAVIQIRPPADTGIAVEWRFDFHYYAVRSTMKALVGAYFPVPSLEQNFWNNPLCFDPRLFPLGYLCSVGVVGFLIFILAQLRRHLPALLVFGAGTAGLLAFYYTKYPGAARHHGFLFVCLVMALWMYRRSQYTLPAAARSGRGLALLNGSLTTLFGIHVLAALLAAGLEIRHPFSAARAVTEYLHRQGHDDSLLVGHVDNTVSALLGYSAQRQIYYPQSQRWGSYIIWNQTRLAPITDQELIDAARALPRRPGQPVLLVLNRSFDEDLIRGNRLRLLGAFTGAVVGDENYHLYQVD
ncbi:MAG: hypothetical protein JNL92_05010 [Opitutaceae bacterium]|nr:hypothetical protein [Opitutaceae bacterium]